MKEINRRNKTERKIYINGYPDLSLMPKVDRDLLFTGIYNIIEKKMVKKNKKNDRKTVDLNKQI
ncbi:MAG: hypothetical protein IJU84_08035 [Clostridia bacterium]|nr:hypothetical protein [Clostridia bacterium]